MNKKCFALYALSTVVTVTVLYCFRGEIAMIAHPAKGLPDSAFADFPLMERAISRTLIYFCGMQMALLVGLFAMARKN